MSSPNGKYALDSDSYGSDKDSGKCCSKRGCLKFLKMNVLTFLMIIFMVIGIIIGVCLQILYDLDKRQLYYLGYPGDLLLRMLKMLIIPLIVSSLISGTSLLSSSGSGKIGGRAVAYYLSTTIIAVILGIILVVSIRPGIGQDDTDKKDNGKYVNVADTLLDLLRNCFPDNLITACFQTTSTYESPVYETYINETTNETVVTENISHYDPVVRIKDSNNILGLVVFSIVFGTVIGRMKEQGRPLVLFFDSLFHAIMQVVRIVIWYAPIGICFIIAKKLASTPDLLDLMKKVGMYMVTVLAGLGIHGLIILPLLYLVLVRKNPLIFFVNMIEALTMAFGTASSSSTFPITVKCLIEKNKVDARVVRTVVPIGTTINMDGTALYEAVAAIFIAQMEGMDLTAANVIIISITATLASIGAAGIPEAGLVTMAMVLTAVGLPLEAQAVILTIDWLLDRFRTAVNVWGDSVGAGIIEKFSQKELEAMDDNVDGEDNMNYVSSGNL